MSDVEARSAFDEGSPPEGGSPADPRELHLAEGPGPEARRSARVLTWIAIGLFCVLLASFRLVWALELADAVLLAILLGAVPGLAIAQVPLVDDVQVERLPAYWSSIATLWILGTACWLVGSRDGGAAALGLVALPPIPFVFWTLALTLAGLLLIVLFHAFALWAGLHDSDLLEQLLPRTGRERGVFALLSVAAGFGEELAYRGYAILILAPLFGVGAGAVLSTVVFGIVHAYQGGLGIVRTGLMGGVLAWGYLAAGSLWPAIAAHVLIDLVAGIWVGERLLVPRSDPSAIVTPTG